MGNSVCPPATNAYLFTYEMRWIRMFIGLGMLGVIIFCRFANLMRQLDNITMLDRRDFEHYLIRTDKTPLGCYPDYLEYTLDVEEPKNKGDPNFHTHEISIATVFVTPTQKCPIARYVLRTDMYRKVDDAQFDGVEWKKYPHCSSALHNSSMYNIVTGRFHVFKSVCYFANSIVRNCVILVADLIFREYDVDMLFKYLRRVARNIRPWPEQRPVSAARQWSMSTFIGKVQQWIIRDIIPSLNPAKRRFLTAIARSKFDSLPYVDP